VVADDGVYDDRIFINCPYDAAYTPLLEAIVFGIIAAGFHPVSARDRLNSAESRLHKIMEMIASCKYSIHDLSRVELDAATQLPRFNMPLELGIDLGCRHYLHTDKVLLILDSNKHRYQRYVSDLAARTSRSMAIHRRWR
jgi:hypothetical protein